MKIVKKNYVVNGPGSFTITPEEEDDLWVVYGLIAAGDTVKADTTRKVSKDQAALRSGKAERRKIKLEIIVGSVDDMDYDKQGSVLRISGKNNLENEHVRIGQSHTLELELHDTFVLGKQLWDSQAIKSLERAADPCATADLAVLLMEERLAHIYLVLKSSPVTYSRIPASIPRKHSVADYDKALKKFYEKVLQDFIKHIDFKVVRCAVIASPGSTKDQFHEHLTSQAQKKDIRNIIENKSSIILVHSKEKDTLREFLDDPIVMKLIEDTKAAPQVRELDHFFIMRNKDEQRTCYGPKHVEVASERMAIERLLITDELIRSADSDTRRRYESLVKAVEDSRGTANVFSSTHLSGQQLAQYTGVAAIIRFPLPDLDEIECDVLR